VSGCVYSKPLKVSETIDDMVAYTKVNDSLFLRILHSSEPELKEARTILENVEHRRLYRFIGQTNPKAGREDVAVTAILPVLFRVHDLDLCFVQNCVTVYTFVATRL